VVARPGAPSAGRRALLGAVGFRFTVLAVASLGLTVATGLYGAGRQVGSVRDLVDTPYGRALLIKSGVLLIVGGLGLLNAARLHGWAPIRLAAPPSRRLLAVEAAAGVVLLLLAGVLGETPPSRGADSTDAGASTAVVRTGSINDIVVSVSVTPNQPGANGFTVVAVSGRRPPPAPIDDVTLEFDGVASGLPLAEIGAGRYFGTGAVPGPGQVRATVVIHRAGARLAVPVEWSVPAAVTAPPAQSSSGGLAPLANGMAALVLAVLAVLAYRRFALVRRGRRVAPPAPEVADRIREKVR
jgi:copper transport protein